jgi:RNA polymerase sigma factor (sigma-70 family)
MVDFTTLYQRYAGDVHRFALFLSGSASDADDITAETFTRALTGGEIRASTVKAYLFTIARNLYLASRARNARNVNIDEKIHDAGRSPEQETADHLSLQTLRRALLLLPEGERAILLMRGDDEMSHQEIAEAFGISAVAVKVRIHRARLRLAALMEPKVGGSHERNA